MLLQQNTIGQGIHKQNTFFFYSLEAGRPKAGHSCMVSSGFVSDEGLVPLLPGWCFLCPVIAWGRQQDSKGKPYLSPSGPSINY